MREADIVVEPQAVPAESRDRTKGIPAPIVGETAVSTGLDQKTTNRWDRIVQFGGKWLDHPAWLLREKGNEALMGLASNGMLPS